MICFYEVICVYISDLCCADLDQSFTGSSCPIPSHNSTAPNGAKSLYGAASLPCLISQSASGVRSGDLETVHQSGHSIRSPVQIIDQSELSLLSADSGFDQATKVKTSTSNCETNTKLDHMDYYENIDNYNGHFADIIREPFRTENPNIDSDSDTFKSCDSDDDVPCALGHHAISGMSHTIITEEMEITYNKNCISTESNLGDGYHKIEPMSPSNKICPAVNVTEDVIGQSSTPFDQSLDDSGLEMDDSFLSDDRLHAQIVRRFLDLDKSHKSETTSHLRHMEPPSTSETCPQSRDVDPHLSSRSPCKSNDQSHERIATAAFSQSELRKHLVRAETMPYLLVMVAIFMNLCLHSSSLILFLFLLLFVFLLITAVLYQIMQENARNN